LNTTVQLVAVLLVALIVWLIWARKAQFRIFLGLTAPSAKSLLWALVTSVVLVPATIGVFLLGDLHAIVTAPNTVAGALRERGPSAETFALIALVGGVKTSLTEELFFRGLLCKRLIAWLGFGVGNVIQAIVFGLVHMIVFVGPSGVAFNPSIAVALFAITAGGGWMMGFLNERVGNGSIAPGWLLHAIANLVSYSVLAFLV
jgi:membrane protease YdiL (CAAX protease family)